MKSFLIISILIAALAACKSDDPTGKDDLLMGTACNTPDAVNNIPWLKNQVTQIESSETHQYSYIQAGNYNGQTVFVFANCCPFCSWIPIAYTCDGTVVENFDWQKLTDSKVFWKSKDNTCQFN